MSAKTPRSNDNDYSPEIIAERQRFIEEKSGTRLQHSKHFSFEPESMKGYCEHLLGVAQVPIGLAVAVELSLVSAARTDKKTGKNEWVNAHEKLGRNR